MPNAKPSPMTADEFLVWNLSQDQKYEFDPPGVGLPLAEIYEGPSPLESGPA